MNFAFIYSRYMTHISDIYVVTSIPLIPSDFGAGDFFFGGGWGVGGGGEGVFSVCTRGA